MRKIFVITFILGVVLLSSCAGMNQTPQAAGEVATLRVMTHDSFAMSEALVIQFEEENKVDLVFYPAGDAGAALNQAILTKKSPLADVYYGVDSAFLSRALAEDIFEAYDSAMLADIPDEFKLDAENRALPVDFGDVCINYDKSYFAEKNLSIPQSLSDLARPEYRGLLVVENPAVSSPGLAFLLATIAEFGEGGYLDYWTQLKENNVVVVNDWETAYYTNFSASSGRGPQPMVVSYGSSPPAEVIFADTPLDEAPTASITAPGTCYRQIEFAGILAGTGQRELAEKFIDFLLSVSFQEDMPLQMFVFPVNSNASLPEAFVKYAQVPAQPAALAPDVIAINRQKWINDWTETMLR